MQGIYFGLARVREWQGKLQKHILQGDGFLLIVIVLVGFGSFGLGRLSVEKETREPVSIEYFSQTANSRLAIPDNNTSLDTAVGGEVVASKTGSKYHYPWCAGAQQIKEENKISFASIEEARKAGYAPAANCKGLK